MLLNLFKGGKTAQELLNEATAGFTKYIEQCNLAISVAKDQKEVNNTNLEVAEKAFEETKENHAKADASLTQTITDSQAFIDNLSKALPPKAEDTVEGQVPKDK